MKAEAMKERPDYALLKLNDVVNFYHLQLPRWLMEDGRYLSLSLEAKFTYTLIFNRFQLSKHNNWINENGEVFVIYTRKDLAEKLNIGEKRVTAAFNELKAYALIWEHRCGRGFANQIYLAHVKMTVDDALQSKGGPLDSSEIEAESETEETGIDDLRSDEMECLDSKIEDIEVIMKIEQADKNVDNPVENSLTIPNYNENSRQEPYEKDLKNRQNSSSKTDNIAVQEASDIPPNYIDFKEKDLSSLNSSQSMSSQSKPSSGYGPDTGQKDTDVIKKIIERCELDCFSDEEALVIMDAIERLYFMEHINVNHAVYPQERIRTHLLRLDSMIVQDSLSRLAKNTTTKIRNSSAYVTKVLFNTIMEYGSDLLVEPYLNFLRSTANKSDRIGGD